MESKPWLNEWDFEPNFAKWRDPATGLLCAIRRNPELKFLCGYVRVPNGKLRRQLIRLRQNDSGRWYGVTGRVYRRYGYGHSRLGNIEVHGGLTFSGALRDYRLSRGFWIGFDCGHAFDLTPGLQEILSKVLKKPNPFAHQMDIYRDFAYVKAEVTGLARQLAEIVKK